MKKNNNNITTIYHDQHDKLKLLVGSSAKAEFLSKLIFYWQISKYKIKNSEHIWFTRTTLELAVNARLSESSVGRYLREFSNKELIEKKVIKRFSKKHGQDIACLHIRITEKLLTLLQTNAQKSSTTLEALENKKSAYCEHLPPIDETASVKLTVPTIYNKENFLNNNIVQHNNVSCEEKQSRVFSKTVFPIEKQIGERVSLEIKNQVKGMLYNVLKDKGQLLAHNETLFTQVLFSVTHQEQYKDILCMKHRINIAATLIRKNLWKVPKGFYAHWDVGQALKERMDVKQRRTSQEKLERELLGVTNPSLIADIKARFERSRDEESRFDKQQAIMVKQKEHASHEQQLRTKLNQLNQEIFHEGKYLQQMQEAFEQGFGYATKELIDSIGIKLAKLYEEQGRVESELQETRQELDLCA